MSAGPHGYELLALDDRDTWRAWLAQNHATVQGVWVEETVRLAAKNERAGP